MSASGPGVPTPEIPAGWESLAAPDMIALACDDRLGAILIAFGPLVIGAIILIIWGLTWIAEHIPPRSK